MQAVQNQVSTRMECFTSNTTNHRTLNKTTLRKKSFSIINADGGKSKTWPERKAHTIEFIKNADRDMKLLSCADKLANIRDIIRDYDRLGDGVWDIFNASKDSVAWYYISMLDAFGNGDDGIRDMPAFKEFEKCVGEMFGDG